MQRLRAEQERRTPQVLSCHRTSESHGLEAGRERLPDKRVSDITVEGGDGAVSYASGRRADVEEAGDLIAGGSRPGAVEPSEAGDATSRTLRMSQQTVDIQNVTTRRK